MQKRSFHVGFSLLELTLASAILSVGTLAVFTLFTHWHGAVDAQEARYLALQKTMLERPQPMYARQFETLKCEGEGGSTSWPEN